MYIYIYLVGNTVIVKRCRSSMHNTAVDQNQNCFKLCGYYFVQWGIYTLHIYICAK